MRRLMHVFVMAIAMVLMLGLAGPAQAGPARPVPIKGTLVGTETDYPADTWETCPVAAEEHAIDWTTGELSMVAGEIVLTAADGDTLTIVPAGDVVLGEPSDGYVDFVSPFAFASGTGRFADASGTLMEIGRSTWPDFPTGSDPWVRELTGTFRGEISYDASNRAAT